MKDYHLKIIEDALLSSYGEEKASKIIHSEVPVAQLVKSLAWEDADFFRQWFLGNSKLLELFLSEVGSFGIGINQK